MKYWAFLADPEAYGWAELVHDRKAVWDGIRNAVAQRNLRACQKGDQALIYHTAPDKAILGIAKVTGEARPDPTNAELAVVDVAPLKPLARPLGLGELKADDVLKEMGFVKMPRVAVQPVTESQWQRMLDLSGTR